MKTKLLGAIASVALFGAVFPADAATYTYTTIAVPGSNYTLAEGINDAGQVVGLYENNAGLPFAFSYSNGNYTPLNFPAGYVANLSAEININNGSQITGGYGPNSGPNQGFLYSGGTYTTINPPGSSHV